MCNSSLPEVHLSNLPIVSMSLWRDENGNTPCFRSLSPKWPSTQMLSRKSNTCRFVWSMATTLMSSRTLATKKKSLNKSQTVTCTKTSSNGSASKSLTNWSSYYNRWLFRWEARCHWTNWGNKLTWTKTPWRNTSSCWNKPKSFSDLVHWAAISAMS